MLLEVKEARGKGGSFKLKPGKNGAYFLQFSFSQSTVATALNDMSKGIAREFNEGVIGQKFVEALAVTIAGIDPKTLSAMRKHLKEAGFTIALEYLSGSLMVASGALIRSSRKGKKILNKDIYLKYNYLDYSRTSGSYNGPCRYS